MSYIAPQDYKCIKCGFEFKFSPHVSHPAPALAEVKQSERGEYTQYKPVCPKCWADFLAKNLGLGYATTVWTEQGSDYEQALKEQP